MRMYIIIRILREEVKQASKRSNEKYPISARNNLTKPEPIKKRERIGMKRKKI